MSYRPAMSRPPLQVKMGKSMMVPRGEILLTAKRIGSTA